MADINTAPRRLNRGGIITFTFESSDFVLKNLGGGTVTIRPGGYTPVEFEDRGVPQTPLRGDGNYSDWEIDCILGSKITAQLPFMLLDQVNTSDANLVKLFGVKVQIPNPQTPSTGETWTDTGCFIGMPGGVELSMGGPGHDRLRVRGRSINPATQWVTY